ncbi:MAG: hypothetical protein U9P71_02225 [Campylobacterota bacterium]|nr:hypothetical protein [Campylobacterota bacterium]
MMLIFHLQSALKDLNDLIDISQQDIEDIKLAQHDSQFKRISLKEEKIKSFENRKAMIDHEISKLMRSNPQLDMSELLDDEQHTALQELKVKLADLSEVNKKYAKMVLSVGSFYNSLLERVIPTEMEGYERVTSKDASFLKVRV